VSSWSSDDELFSLVSGRLYTAVLGDILDRLGHRHQFLPPQVRQLKAYGVVVGRAMPVLEADVFDFSDPFGKMFEALDDLKSGEIYVAAGGSRTYAFFGELMSIAAAARGAKGAVLHGYHRDTAALAAGDFPVYSMGGYGQDQGVRGRVLDYRTAIEIAGVTVSPGDLIVADSDGVLVVPRDAEATVVSEALGKVGTESDVREALSAGMSVKAAFDRFKVM